MSQQPPPGRWAAPEADHDLDFNGAVADDTVVEDAWTSWRREVAFAETYTKTLADWSRTVPMHGDLLRECIDRRTGQ